MALQQIKSPRFTQRVVAAMRSLYPEELADRSWDNVGLLQENIEKVTTAPASVSTVTGYSSVSPIVLLTNDLTLRVADEAIRKGASVIVSYHPFIFRGLKSVTLADPQQQILLRLAQANIAVYSPHTAVDAVPGGVNDFLADMLDGHGVTTRRSVIKPSPPPLPQGFAGAGMGRLVELGHAVNIGRIVEAYAKGLGGLRHVSVAWPKPLASKQNPQTAPIAVKTVAICAGSGYDVIKDTDADMFITGEMSHHFALRLTMMGKTVLTVLHSNSERQFLKKRMAGQLRAELKKDVPAVEVLVSEEDEDPFEVWDVQRMPAFAYD
ncbi:protein NIF3 [Echria macrotheca]|uniref:Protein NIF3 n=1 Tax=Echria macrotheca TaxID=438768 RepID=A0AAJ0FDK6_9PEZI|nr:protein NIF3 [Echria macrotheca]